MRIRQGMLGWLMGVALASTGCAGQFQQLCQSDSAPMVVETTWEQQNHVYVFLINGIDPFQMGNLVGLRQQLADLGYDHAYYGQLYHCRHFAKVMRKVMCDDPQARFVVVGYSAGAMPAYYLAEEARHAGLPIDLVVLIAGKGMNAVANFHPDESIRVVDIAAFNLVFQGKFPNPARAVDESEAGHFQAPMHERTVRTLMEELSLVASSVPVTAMKQGPEPSYDLAQALHPVTELSPERMSRPTVPVSSESAEDH